ncbi:MAG: hypothetical protein GY821_03175 [Gammaproteobacteria bacterium]|nr:hypothetical protein [Gammaproteobacteria bacterium]
MKGKVKGKQSSGYRIFLAEHLLRGKWRKAESSAAVSTDDSSSFGGQEKWR